MKGQFYIVTFFWLVIALALGGLAVVFFGREQFITSILLVLLALALFIWRLSRFQQKFVELEKLLLSIQQKDFSLFPNPNHELSVYNHAVELYYQAKEENRQVEAYKVLYEDILDNLDFGLMILVKPTETENWNVFYTNPKMLQTLDVPHYNEWSYYQEKIPSFHELVSQRFGQDSQEFMDVSIQASAKNSFSLRTANLTTADQSFCIVTLESVQQIVERKEKLAWNNLMKVISHELLNTLTPINSLIDNVQYIAKQGEIDAEEKAEMQESLEIIQSKSAQLLHFINDYRQVAQLPKPQFVCTSIKPVIENVLRLMQPEFAKHNIEVKQNLLDTKLAIDEKMVERVLINLFTNAIYAFGGNENRVIEVQTIDSLKRFHISISDNGVGVDEKIREKIFMPFFTTRENGSGIGLTLAKSIMEAHKGYLTYRAVEQGSVFEVVFVK